MSVELFIYWHPRPGEFDAAVRAVHAAQSRLRERHPGLQAAAYARRGHERETLMESYAMPRLDAVVLEADSATLLAPWADDGRHAERFERITPDA